MADSLPVGKEKSGAELMRLHAQLASRRYNFESLWQRVADLIWTASATFQRAGATEGERRDQFQFDSTGALALDRGASALESMLTPQTQRWHGLKPVDKELRKDLDIQRYCEDVTDILFAARYSARAGFNSAVSEHFRQLLAYGTSPVFVEDALGAGLRYQCQHLNEIYIASNFQGMIDTVHRKFEFTARQALQKFGPDALMGEYRKLAERNAEQPVTFVHCVSPAEDYDPTSRDRKRMPIQSCYVDVKMQEKVQEGGYFTMPYIVSRFTTSPREVYGRSPAITVLSTLNSVNEMQKTLLRAGQKAVDPPLMAVDDDELRGYNLRAGAINYGALDSQGNERVKPMATGANLPLGLEMVQAERDVINNAFFVTLFQILVENPQMTATEALIRAQEKGELLAPALGRQQSDFLGPLITRELDVLNRAGRLPDMPDVLAEAGGFVDIEYTSPLNILQRAGDGVAILRTIEALTPIAQYDPKVFAVLNFARMGRKIAEINGTPADCLNSEEEVANNEAMAAQSEQAAQMIAAAPAIGKTALDLSKAQATAASSPSPSSIGQ